MYKIVRKKYLEHLEKENETLERDRRNVERPYKDKLARIKQALEPVINDSKHINKLQIVQILQDIYNKEF